MGSKTSKMAGSTANVINTVEIFDHHDDIQDVNKTIFVLGFCEPPSYIARIYINKPIITSPKAQDPERRDLIAQD